MTSMSSKNGGRDRNMTQPDEAVTRAHARVEDLLAEVEQVRTAALEYVREYADREGNVHQSLQPDFRCALSATELKAKLLGYLGDGRTMSLDQLRTELDRLGFRLEPKAKPKAVGK